MRRLALIAALAAGLMPGVGAGGEPPEILIESARLWERRDRPDLARLALEKVLRAHPGHPEASLKLGDLELRSNHIDAAREVLAALEARHPGHPAVQQLRDSLRLYTQDRLRLATMRRLRDIGEGPEAAALARELFPQGPPPGPLALEYWSTLAADPAAFDEARAGLRTLQQTYPEDRRYAVALARIEVTRPDTRPAALRRLAALAEDPQADPTEVLSAWRMGLSYLSDQPENRPYFRAFLRHTPEDAVAERGLAAIEARERTAARRLQDPVYRRLQAAERALSEGALDEAQGLIETAARLRPGDGAHLGTLGLLRLRQGRYAEAERLFEQAARQDRDATARWQGQRDWARYRIALDDADHLLDHAAPAAAQARIDQARRLQPGHPDAELRQARLWAAIGREAEAEARYRRLLSGREPPRAAATELLALLERQGRHAEAEPLLAELAARAPDQATAWNRLRAAQWRREADEALAADQPGQALSLLEDALALAPDQPWIRHDLARRYLALDLPEEARALMAEGAAHWPEDPDQHYARALILASLDDAGGALSALSAVPETARSAGMDQLARRMALQQALAEARQQRLEGNASGARTTLVRAESLAGQDPQRLADVALVWLDLGEPARAQALFAARPAEDDPEWSLARARLLLALDDRPTLDATLAELRRAPLDHEQQQRLAFFERRRDIAEVRALNAEGRSAEALARFRGSPSLVEIDRESLELEVALLLGLHRGTEADARVAAELARSPEDPDLRLLRAETLRDIGRRGDARVVLGALEDDLPADDGPRRGALVREWLALGDRRAAARSAEALASAAPGTVDAEVAHARVAQARHRHGEALAHYQAARTLELARGDRGWSAARFGIDRIEARPDGHVAVALGHFDRSGSDGISAYRALQMPVEVRWPRGYEGHFFAVVDAIDADAGRLPGDAVAAARFGSVQAGGPAALAASPEGIPQNARGVDLGLGWESDRLRVDLGTTPIGFPVENWAGGLRWNDRHGALGYGLNLSRRPVTGSLLSYAGVRDPVSGQVWGGVMRTGLDTRISGDLGRYSASLSLGAHALRGRNVLDNRQYSLRLALDRPLLRRDSQRLDAGIALAGWRYDVPLGEFTFGHGGYYSPQRYWSLSTPVEWSGRWQRLAWQLRGALAYSDTATDAQVFHPTDPALQAAAEAQAGSNGFGVAAYDGGDGGGSSVSLRGALEYQATRHWYLGGAFELDRSEFYTPNFFNLYLRYDFDGEPARIRFPPRPPQPYSSY